MKKGLIQFSVVFVLVLMSSYVIAALQQQNSPKTQTKSTSSNTLQVKLTSPKIEKINTQGLARYIGVSSLQFKENFGTPTLTYQTVQNVEWWLYNLNSTQYLRVGIDNYTGKVSSIFVLGNHNETTPFSLGMSVKDLLKLTTFYANFEITVHEQKFQLELSEYDMNHYPLIAFKNGSYAICYLNEQTKRVVAIEYLSSDELLRKNFYKVISKTPLPVEFGGQVDWQKIPEAIEQDILQSFNVKRQLNQQSIFTNDLDLSQLAQQIAQQILTNPQKYLTKHQQINLTDMQNDEFSQKYFWTISNSKKIKAAIPALNNLDFDILAPVFSGEDLFTQSHFVKLTQKILNDGENLGIYYDKGLLVIVRE